VTKKKTTAKNLSANSKPHNSSKATVESILGHPIVSKKSKTNSSGLPKIKREWAKYHKNLLSLRERLLDQMNGLAKESAQEMSNYSLHMADSGTDNFDRDFALSLLSSDQDAVYEIEEALKRIEKNTFGVCELTGKTIPKARLDAIPWTRFTVEAQARLERDGVLRNRKLGSLGSIDSRAISDIEEEEDDKSAPSQKTKE
jgi:DnaK suppressor protein